MLNNTLQMQPDPIPFGTPITKMTCTKCGTVIAIACKDKEADLPCEVCKSLTKHVRGVVQVKPATALTPASKVESPTK